MLFHTFSSCLLGFFTKHTRQTVRREFKSISSSEFKFLLDLHKNACLTVVVIVTLDVLYLFLLIVLRNVRLIVCFVFYLDN